MRRASIVAVLAMSAFPAGASADTSLVWVENRNAIGCHPDCGFDLWRMAPDGSGASMTASSASRNALWADWTPMGDRIVYAYKFTTPEGDEASQLRIMNADLSGDREVAAERPGFRMTPEWSPDGSRVVFTLYEPGRFRGAADLFTVEADGSGLRRLASLPGDELEPSYTWAGARVIFARQDASRPPAVTSIWSVRADGTDPREHVNGDALVSLHNVAPSPFGGSVAFSGADGRIFVASLDGGGIDPVAPRVGLEPSWSPDGASLAYVRLGQAREQTLWRVPVHQPDRAVPLRENFQQGYGIDGADWVTDAPPMPAVAPDEVAPAVTLARLRRRDGAVVKTTFGPTSSPRRARSFRVARRRDLAFAVADSSGIRRVAVTVRRLAQGSRSGAVRRIVVDDPADWGRVRRRLGRGAWELKFRSSDAAGNAATSRRVTVRIDPP